MEHTFVLASCVDTGRLVGTETSLVARVVCVTGQARAERERDDHVVESAQINKSTAYISARQSLMDKDQSGESSGVEMSPNLPPPCATSSCGTERFF